MSIARTLVPPEALPLANHPAAVNTAALGWETALLVLGILAVNLILLAWAPNIRAAYTHACQWIAAWIEVLRHG